MYKIKFVDGSVFDGGEPENSLWDKIPVTPIKSIVYWLNEELKFSFTEFEEYCSCVERVKGLNNGIEMVSKAIIMGRVGQRVYQVVFDLKKGCIYQLVTIWGQEYSNQENIDNEGNFKGWLNAKPLSGWKQGILGGNPKLKKITL